MVMASRVQALLDGKKADAEALASAAMSDDGVLEALLDEVSPQSRNSKRRYNSFKVLSLIGERHPARLYPRWDYLEALLRSSNDPSRYIAVNLLPLLAGVDRENRWAGVLKDYLALTRFPSLPLAGHAVMGCSVVARMRPEFRDEITASLLSLGRSRMPTERKALLNAYAVESLGGYFADAPDKKAIVSFVRSQTKSKSPKGRKAAELFLKKYARHR